MKSDGLTWPLFYTGVFYLVFVGILTLLFNYIEKSWIISGRRKTWQF